MIERSHFFTGMAWGLILSWGTALAETNASHTLEKLIGTSLASFADEHALEQLAATIKNTLPPSRAPRSHLDELLPFLAALQKALIVNRESIAQGVAEKRPLAIRFRKEPTRYHIIIDQGPAAAGVSLIRVAAEVLLSSAFAVTCYLFRQYKQHKVSLKDWHFVGSVPKA